MIEVVARWRTTRGHGGGCTAPHTSSDSAGSERGTLLSLGEMPNTTLRRLCHSVPPEPPPRGCGQELARPCHPRLCYLVACKACKRASRETARAPVRSRNFWGQPRDALGPTPQRLLRGRTSKTPSKESLSP